MPAGYSNLAWNDYRLNPEHPPLLKEWAALPLLFLDLWPRSIETTPDPAALTSPTFRSLWFAWTKSAVSDVSQFDFGHHFLYGLRDGALHRLGVTDPLLVPGTARLSKDDFFNDADRLLFLGRVQIMFLGLLLALLVFLWARELYGPSGGVLALGLYCFDPNFIANAGLVTTDVGVSLFMFGAMYFFWRTSRQITSANVLLLVVMAALGFAAKFTAILLVPMLFAAGAARVLSREAWQASGPALVVLSTRARKAIAFLALMAGVGLAAYGAVWAVYGFRFSAVRDPGGTARAVDLALGPGTGGSIGERGSFPIEFIVRRGATLKRLVESGEFPESVPEPEIERRIGETPLRPSGRMILLAHRWRLLPESYLYGLAYAEMASFFRPTFLLGRHSNAGSPYYFPLVFLLKTPILTLVGIGVSLVYVLRRHHPAQAGLAFLLLPVAVYLVAALTSKLNIGHRHLLPIYPFLFVLTGGLGVVWGRITRHRVPVAVAALLAIATSALVVFAPPWRPAIVYPYYLAYFNELAGGPRRGHESFVDSNLDWGQELKGLKGWLDAHGVTEPINLSYFGTADPRYYQIAHLNLIGGYEFEPHEGGVRVPGLLAISATHLEGAYYTSEYRAALARVLAGAKLVDVVGYSIFIFRLERPAQESPLVR